MLTHKNLIRSQHKKKWQSDLANCPKRLINKRRRNWRKRTQKRRIAQPTQNIRAGFLICRKTPTSGNKPACKRMWPEDRLQWEVGATISRSVTVICGTRLISIMVRRIVLTKWKNHTRCYLCRKSGPTSKCRKLPWSCSSLGVANTSFIYVLTKSNESSHKITYGTWS